MWSRGDTQSPRLKAFLSFSDLFTHSTSQSSQPNIYRPSRCLVLLGVGTEKMKDPSSLSRGSPVSGEEVTVQSPQCGLVTLDVDS